MASRNTSSVTERDLEEAGVPDPIAEEEAGVPDPTAEEEAGKQIDYHVPMLWLVLV